MEQVYPNVTNDVQESVNNFILDLKSRIELLNDISTANLNPEEYEHLNELIKNQTRRQASELKLDDLTLFRYDEMEKILNIVCPNQEERQHILNLYNMNMYIYKESKNETQVGEARYFFENIKKKITDYVFEYTSRNREENEHTQGKTDKYTFYIDLMSAPTLNRYMTLEELDTLKKDLKTFGLLENDIINILIYINDKNIGLSKSKEVDPALCSRISKLGSEYITDNKELVEDATKIITDGFDPDELETIAIEKAKELNVPSYKLNNTIVTLIVNSFYHEYEKMIKEEENVEEINQIKDEMNTLLKKVIYVDPVVMQAEDILLLNKEIMEEYQAEAYDFLEMKATDIEQEKGNINLKALPILMKIKETVLNIKTKDRKSDEYYIVRELLSSLINEYNEIMNRLETIRTV